MNIQLSESSLARLKLDWKTLTQTLVRAGAIDRETFDREISIPIPPNSSISVEDSPSLLDLMRDRFWMLQFEETLESFRAMFLDAACSGNTAQAYRLRDELHELLGNLAASPMRQEPQLWAAEPDDKKPEPSPEPSEVSASAALELEDDTESKSLAVAIQARSRGDNEHEIEGVLFHIDQPSEAIPEIGPGLPLYIPREVAIAAIADINSAGRPKPLDAHDSFSQHAGTEIVGAMTSARLDGNAFVVKGVLWDFNQPTKVEAIAKTKDSLGMSVNASADGHVDSVDGKPCWRVTKLKIKGANILLANRATFRTTRLISASEEQQPIAASAGGDSAMNLEYVAAQLDEIGQGIQASSDKIGEFEDRMRDLDRRLDKFERERNRQREEITAAAEQSREDEQQEAFFSRLEAIVEGQNQKIEALANRMESGSKPRFRRSVPLAASGLDTSANTTNLPVQAASQLAKLEARLETMREYGADRKSCIEVAEQIRDLKNQHELA